MDQKSKENLARIVALEPEALSEGDLAFLRAREAYLTADEKEKFADLLNPKPEAKPKKKEDK